MTRYVIDTSVAIKWFLPLKAEESHVSKALQILNHVLVGEIQVLSTTPFYYRGHRCTDALTP